MNDIKKYDEKNVISPKSFLSFEVMTSGADPKKNSILAIGYVYNNPEKEILVQKEDRCRLEKGKELDLSYIKENEIDIKGIKILSKSAKDIAEIFIDSVADTKPDIMIGYDITPKIAFIYNVLSDEYRKKMLETFPLVLDLKIVLKNKKTRKIKIKELEEHKALSGAWDYLLMFYDLYTNKEKDLILPFYDIKEISE
ncbi:MAG: hypothetical protein ACP5IV_08020 [Caldisericia bacterium]